MENKSIPRNDCYRMNGQSVSSLKASKDYSLGDSLLEENPLVRDKVPLYLFICSTSRSLLVWVFLLFPIR